MPTAIFLYGWRFSLFSNEGNKPVHIHTRKGDKIANIGYTGIPLKLGKHTLSN
jgi:hypothetical protein